MEPLAARMDFEFDPLPEGFGARVEELVNAELAADRPIEVSFLPRAVAVAGRGPDPHQGQPHPRVGAGDPGRRHRRARQAGRRRHPRALRPREVGRIRVVKTESKGKGNKRIRIEVRRCLTGARSTPSAAGSASSGRWSSPSRAAPTRPSSPGWPTTPSAPTGRWPSPRCRRRCRPRSGDECARAGGRVGDALAGGRDRRARQPRLRPQRRRPLLLVQGRPDGGGRPGGRRAEAPPWCSG